VILWVGEVKFIVLNEALLQRDANMEHGKSFKPKTPETPNASETHSLREKILNNAN